MDSVDMAGVRDAEVGTDAAAPIGDLLDSLFDELFPILRSISGPGLRRSLDILARHMPLETEVVPTGTRVFDWEVPPEWHMRSARLTGPNGRTIADASVSSLHVLNYSAAVDTVLSREALERHLHSLPALPDAIPYVTSYYNRNWGFCLSHTARQSLPPGDYRAVIDSEFVMGGIPVAHCVLPGESAAEVLLSSYLCHPSLANNELSGPLVLLGLYRRLAAWPRRRYSYRFVINPETIGSLCYLYHQADHLRRHMAYGMVLTCVGGPQANLSYKMSRRGDSVLDLVMLARAEAGRARVREFDPTSGSDERQYCSPGFNLPMGQIARTIYGEYDGYHNSLDDKAFMSIESLVKSVDEIESLLKTAEIAGHFRNQSPFGEPQLGRRGLYPTVNSAATWQKSNDTLLDARTFLNRLLTVLNYSDGRHSILDIAAKADLSVEDFRTVVERLEETGLLKLEPQVMAP
jgi:aminopeptidase-like protein